MKTLKKGDPIDLYLVVTSDDAMGPTSLPVATSAIYYPTAADAQAKIELSAAGIGLRSVKLTLPDNAKAAYGAASTGLVELFPVLTTIDGAISPLGTVRCKTDGKACILPMTLVQGSASRAGHPAGLPPVTQG